MKKIMVLFLLSGVLFSACLFTTVQKEIKGSGTIVTESRNVSSFKKIDVSGDFDINLTQADAVSLVLTADDNLATDVISEVSGDTLKVYVKNGVSLKPSRRMVLNIAVSELEDIDNSGSATIRSQGALQLESLTMNLSGTSDVNLSLSADSLTVNMSGSSDVRLSGMVSNSLTLILSGTGSVDALDCPAKSAVLRISGSGDMRVNVSDSLSATITGVGNVYYKGQPSVTQHISGMGKVASLN